MEMPNTLYIKEKNGVLIHSPFEFEGENVIEYVRADKIAIKLGKLLEELNTKEEVILDKMKEVLG